MRKSERAEQARRELDRKFARSDLGPIRARPRGGWIRAVRTGLGMSQGALATRLGVSAPNVAGLEASELKETISIGKLAEVARAMDCTLLYVLVPNSTLEDTVRKQANQVASATLGYVATTMDLEDQRVDAERHQQVLAIEAARVIESNRQWRTEP